MTENVEIVAIAEIIKLGSPTSSTSEGMCCFQVKYLGNAVIVLFARIL